MDDGATRTDNSKRVKTVRDFFFFKDINVNIPLFDLFFTTNRAKLRRAVTVAACTPCGTQCFEGQVIADVSHMKMKLPEFCLW